MKNTKVIIVIIAILAIAGGVWYFAFRSSDTKQPVAKVRTGQVSSTQTTKSDVEKNFESYTGQDYDRYYMANMISHHQGAVDMAKLALINAKHTEIKALAQNIITTQTTEQNSMIAWQKAWSYPSSSGSNMQDMSAMGMDDEMAAMNKKLEGKTGDDFDKAFLEQMIIHHTSAIDMSKPAAQNALHQEIKDLAKAVISAQTSEVNNMKQWQKSWGYNVQ